MFQAFHKILGFRMKEEKSKQPAFAQTLLGIEWFITLDAIFASPGSRRVSKLVEVIESYLTSHVSVRMFATHRQAVLQVHVGFQPGWSLVFATVVLRTTQRLADSQVETGVVSTQRTSSPSTTETVRHRR